MVAVPRAMPSTEARCVRVHHPFDAWRQCTVVEWAIRPPTLIPRRLNLALAALAPVDKQLDRTVLEIEVDVVLLVNDGLPVSTTFSMVVAMLVFAVLDPNPFFLDNDTPVNTRFLTSRGVHALSDGLGGLEWRQRDAPDHQLEVPRPLARLL